MKKHKWYVALSLVTFLLGNIAPIVAAQEVSSIITQIDSELLAHQVKDGDQLPAIAKQLKIDENLLKQVNSRSKFKLASKGNWAVLYKKRYLILSDAHFHEYAVYDLVTPDKKKDLPYSKIIADNELKQLLTQLHEQLGHLDNGEHAYDGHTITDFNPDDIVSEDENGYVIKHGDHFHYIPKTHSTDNPQ